MAADEKSSDLMKNAAPIMFGLIIFAGFLYLLFSLLNHEYPAANKDQINSLIEFIKNASLIVVGFFFGSSASNKTKDETISDIAKMPIAAGTGNGTVPSTTVTTPPGATTSTTTTNETPKPTEPTQ